MGKALKKTLTHIQVEEHSMPLHIYYELRTDIRMSMGKKHIMLRVPALITGNVVKEYIQKTEQWVAKQFVTNPKLRLQYFGKEYADGATLQVGQRLYTMHLVYEERSSHSGNIQNKHITLRIVASATKVQQQKAIKTLLSRLIGNDYLYEITQRVMELNHLYFKQPIKNVSMKYNHSNWGSCSAKSNINLSTRLLFAPPDVIDYVIIHELAHLLELNHSDRFWRLVSDAMSDYPAKEKWLKTNGHLCDF